MSTLNSKGTHLYFACEHDQNIYQLEIKTHLITSILIDTLRNGRPVISPDDRLITFNTNRENEADKNDLWLMTVKGDSLKRLTRNSTYYYSASWSPDGTMLAYSAGKWGSRHIWLFSLETLTSKLIIDAKGNNCLPQWSPDGKRIAFYSDRNDNKDIWVFELATERLQQITFHKANDVCPQWSPDGRKIAFASNRTGNMEIWIVEIRQ